ncbi:hypothetical protein ACFE04_020480 [Oxalis oulophora]
MNILSSTRKLSNLFNQTHRHYHITTKHNHQVINNPQKPTCDVFINHRGNDTKRTVAGLLYSDLSQLGIKSFLDCKNMKAGDRLFDKINRGIRDCKIGVAVFSPRYCESYFCLHELALLMETKRRVIPIFVDVKPSDLFVKDDGSCSRQELERFRFGLEEAKNTVGLTFDTLNGDWSDFLATATNAVIENLIQVQEEEEGLDESPIYLLQE